SELDRVPSHLSCDDVHLGLIGPANLHDPEPTKRAGWRLVRVDAERVDANVRDVVGPGARIPGLVGHAGPDVSIRARVPEHLAVPGQDAAVVRYARPQPGGDSVLGDCEEFFL